MITAKEKRGSKRSSDKHALSDAFNTRIKKGEYSLREYCTFKKREDANILLYRKKFINKRYRFVSMTTKFKKE